MKRIPIAAVLAMALVCGGGRQALASGAGAINLVFPVGARYNAMGEAGTALAQDVTAMWWNPGGLAFMAQSQLHIMQSSLAEGLADDIGLYWLGYGTRLGDIGGLAVSLNYLDMGEQQGTDENSGDKGTFASYEWALTATGGVQVSESIGVGLGVKYFRDQLAPDDLLQDAAGGGGGDSFGVDLGLLWRVPSVRSNFGLAVANLGPGIKHVDADQSDPMPRKVTFGIAHNLYSSDYMRLLLVGDYLVPLYKYKDDSWGTGFAFEEKELGGGVEWGYLRSLFVRFGYKSAEFGDISDITYGFGVDMEKWLGTAITFDFASVPQATGLPKVTRLSFGGRF
jgi:hypothetical protein